jgi:signal transduction histidine kinase
VATIEDVSEDVRAEETLRRRAQELAALNAIGQQVSSSLSVQQVIQAALDEILPPLNPDLALFFLRQGDDLVLQGVAPTGSPYSHSETPVHRVGECLCGLAVHEGRPIYAKDVQEDPRCTWMECKTAGICSFVALPLRSGDEIIGILGLASGSPRDFSERAAFLETLADQVATGLQNALLHQEVRRYASHLEQRVAERTAQLKAVNEELEAFAYSVSHDLRAPLRSIDGFGQALLEDYEVILDAIGQNYLQRVCAASQRMGQLIDDMLTLSRLTRREMHQEENDLSSLARGIARELEEMDPGREVEFNIAEGITAHGDPGLLRVVMENLLGNAWKFTAKHPQARIEFGVVESDGRPTYYVRDDGAGFDMAYADKLFGAFQRLHRMQEFEGSGIGLATVQRIVHRHGGRVWAEGAVEQGATFYFQLDPSEGGRE